MIIDCSDRSLTLTVADIVKMIESQPELAPRLRRVRGGYLKIQGTWMPYEIALKLARRWVLRIVCRLGHLLMPAIGSLGQSAMSLFHCSGMAVFCCKDRPMY